MPIIYADTSDGVIRKTGQSTYNNAREATFGSVTDSAASSTLVEASYYPSRRGGITYSVSRSFYAFDISSISACSAVTLNIHGRTDRSSDDGIIVVRSTAFGGDGATALASGDFDAIHGWNSTQGSMIGAATPYSSAFPTSSWSSTGYNSITLDQNSITSIIASASNNYILLAVVDFAYDYSKVGPPQGNSISAYFSNNAGFSKDPYLDITTGSHGGFNVNTVVNAAIGGINTVSGVNIGKINTVD